MAGKRKHMERSRRSYRDHMYKKSYGLNKIASVSNKKQTIFARFKDSLVHRKNPQPKGDA